MPRKLFWLILLSLPFMILLSAIFAFTASNTVSVSGLDDESQPPVTAEQLKPSACDGLTLGTIITDGNGSTGNDLVLGTAGIDTLDGGEGDDCLVAGDGDDTLDGGPGDGDVCIGGAGVDDISNCETIIDP